MRHHAVAQWLRGESTEGAAMPLFLFGQTDDVLAWVDDHTDADTIVIVDAGFDCMADCVTIALGYLVRHRAEHPGEGSIKFIKYW